VLLDNSYSAGNIYVHIQNKVNALKQKHTSSLCVSLVDGISVCVAKNHSQASESFVMESAFALQTHSRAEQNSAGGISFRPKKPTHTLNQV
jgi:hypothetical protein